MDCRKEENGVCPAQQSHVIPAIGNHLSGDGRAIWSRARETRSRRTNTRFDREPDKTQTPNVTITDLRNPACPSEVDAGSRAQSGALSPDVVGFFRGRWWPASRGASEEIPSRSPREQKTCYPWCAAPTFAPLRRTSRREPANVVVGGRGHVATREEDGFSLPLCIRTKEKTAAAAAERYYSSRTSSLAHSIPASPPLIEMCLSSSLVMSANV
ncbi:hypothetical protein MRX96_027146 [Rhipicephalus microplus]